ncbi:Uncharacterized protein BC141101_06022 [Bacillus toyonensis]|uniref:hypothetical protein n=1 Tax=Bacillus TaxID=1386 RepID=UPI00027BF9D1|nr:MULTISPECIES: hypothetical protein [Bacillus cereus group]KAB0449428.1 hypothetical protein CH334_04500 [Lysinibacillus sp. VIA-II-2016]EJV90187.1 hypothetical protein IGI_05447 [Bacillus toyonensis]EOP46228.1 hypothetical protein IKI_05182 [Bacillus toyonensis]MBJ7950285.1 hypothetical protein [Bacillus cereus group sp. N24]MBJ8133830.1 hypothetical protein [Bacillus cereus group sp. N3]
MKSKLIIVLCLIGIIIPSSKALANGEIITRKEVRNYYYIVDKENNNYTWRIGYKTSNSIIKENELNLEDFRNAVNKLSQQNLELYVSIAYLIILLLILLISFIKKNNDTPKCFLIFMFVLLIISINAVVQTSISLSVTNKEAQFLYLRLTH